MTKNSTKTATIIYALVDLDCLIYPAGFYAESRKIDWKTTSKYFQWKIASIITDMKTTSPYYGSPPIEVHYYITGKGSPTYRDQFRSVIPYKENRKMTGIKPRFIRELIELSVDTLPNLTVSEPEIGEADDYLAMHAYKKSYIDTCIVGVDKDLHQIPGWHYNCNKKEATKFSPWQSLRFLYKQMLIGDTADCIPGIKGIGPVTAENILKSARNEQNLFDAVCETYENHAKLNGGTVDDATQLLYETGNLMYLRKTPLDMWDPFHGI